MDAATEKPNETSGSTELKDEGMELLGFMNDPFSAADAAEGAAAPSDEPEKKEDGEEADEASEAVTGEETTDGEQAQEEAADDKKEPEQKAEDKKDEKKDADPAAIPEELKSIFPEAKEMKEVAAAVADIKQRLEEEKSANNEMVDLLQSHKALIPILRDLRDGKPLYEAIRGRLELTKDEVIPDPATDPKGYATYAKKQIELEQRLEREAKEQKEATEKAEAARAEAVEARAEFQKENKLSDGEMEKFLKHISVMLYGDPSTGKLPKDYLKLMYRTYTYEADVKAAEQKGEQKGAVTGRNEAIDKMLHKQDVKADGLPSLRSGVTRRKAIVDDLSDLEKSLQAQPDIFNV